MKKSFLIDVAGNEEKKRSWCSVGRGIYRRDDPLSFLMIIGFFIYVLVVFLAVAFEAIIR